jgi:hypothetical protein
MICFSDILIVIIRAIFANNRFRKFSAQGMSCRGPSAYLLANIVVIQQEQ